MGICGYLAKLSREADLSSYLQEESERDWRIHPMYVWYHGFFNKNVGVILVMHVKLIKNGYLYESAVPN